MLEKNAVARTIPLVKSLADPVFGGSVPEVAADFTYHLEYRGEKSREFTVSVFEHPRLVRADADLVFPDYTKLPPKRIEETRRVSAVVGTKLDFSLQLNKPVASAQLVARDGKKTAIPLTVTAGKAVATLTAFELVNSQTYDLKLVDSDGRVNKIAAPFVIGSLLYNVALGIINRAMPQLMVAFIGAPALTWGGLALFAVAAPLILSVWLAAFAVLLNKSKTN